MTYFLAVDPGKTTGVAWWHPESEAWAAYQTTDPHEAMRWLEMMILNNDHNYEITVERYTGGGYKTADGNLTSELAGWFKNHFEYFWIAKVRYPISNQRMSGMDRAEELINDSVIPIPGPHSKDALAHAIVHARMFA